MKRREEENIKSRSLDGVNLVSLDRIPFRDWDRVNLLSIVKGIGQVLLGFRVDRTLPRNVISGMSSSCFSEDGDFNGTLGPISS